MIIFFPVDTKEFVSPALLGMVMEAYLLRN
jgi:hypothetical protein